MTMTIPIRNIVREIAIRFGIRLEEARPGEEPTRFVFRFPKQFWALDLGEQLFALGGARPEQLSAFLDHAIHGLQRSMFREVIAHIAKHDRDPLDRVAAIEAQAKLLIDALRGTSPMSVESAIRELERLLNAKPGAASWQRNGYGEDPPR